MSVISMLASPNDESPANIDAAVSDFKVNQWIDDFLPIVFRS